MLFVVLAYESRGVELSLRGLNIECLLPPNLPNAEAAVPTEADYLDDMLQSVTFSAAILDERVLTVLAEEPTEHSDTDESAEEEKSGDNMKLNFFRFSSKYGENRSKIRLRPSEINHNQSPPDHRRLVS